jgi:hypothetical protein
LKTKYELALVADEVAVTISGNFILAGEFFRAVQEKLPERFAELAYMAGFHVRDAERLAALDRRFKELNIDRESLYKIGLAKIQVIAAGVTLETAESLLRLAETSSVSELVALIQSRKH